MSFGFSVSDIILLSKFSYRLYSTLTTGRRGASRDLKELEDVLFGLRCALDHLGKVTNDISATASSNQDSNSIDVRQKLNLMIDSCGSTLRELDAVTEKYREGVKQIEGDADEDIVASDGLAKRLKRNFEVNWMKVRWDTERQSLREYRYKLQSHTDAINIVLNTFLWSTTHRMEADVKVSSAKMQEQLSEALQSNVSLLQLVKEIHVKLLASKSAPLPQHEPSALPFRAKVALAGSMVAQKKNVVSMDPHYGTPMLMAMTTVPNPTGDVATQSRAPAMPLKTHSNNHITSPYVANTAKLTKMLPIEIVELNNKRQATGRKEFEQYKQKHSQQDPPAKPSFLTVEMPTIPQLCDGLTYIFRPFFPRPTRQTQFARDERKGEIVRWVQGLDQLLNLWISDLISSPSCSGDVMLARQTDVVDLLVHLNGLIEKSDWEIRTLFYQASRLTRIDNVLDKVQTVSKSVRCRKEIEEFEDEREEWRDKYDSNQMDW